MSLVIISPDLDDFDGDACGACLTIQLVAFRNKIKEQFNRYIADGKPTNRVVLNFEIDPNHAWEQPVTLLNGSPICLTHYFMQIHMGIERNPVSQIEVANGSIDSFLKRKG